MLTVVLCHGENPDIRGDGYWTPPVDDGFPQIVEVKGLRHASKVCREFITRNGLGGGNWFGPAGEVYRDGIKVARVSYNGRLWDNDGAEILFN